MVVNFNDSPLAIAVDYKRTLNINGSLILCTNDMYAPVLGSVGVALQLAFFIMGVLCSCSCRIGATVMITIVAAVTSLTLFFVQNELYIGNLVMPDDGCNQSRTNYSQDIILLITSFVCSVMPPLLIAAAESKYEPPRQRGFMLLQDQLN